MRPLLPLLAALALASVTVAAPAASPSFLVILADDLGYSDLGCYGGEIPTPHLDALAAGGLRFTQAYSTARCWPSRAAVLTGFYAQQVRRDVVPGVPSGARGLRPAWAPLASELLAPAGYRSLHAGKWHVDGTPRAQGFAHSFEIGQGQNNFFLAPGNTDDGVPGVQTPDYHVTAATAEHAVKYLRDHAARFPGRPFFLYLAFTAPHFPLHAPAADIARHRDAYHRGWNEIAAERHARQRRLGLVRHDLPPMERDVGPPYAFPDAIRALGPGEVDRPLPWTELTPEQRSFQAAKMAVHAAMVDQMDRELGRVLAQLRAMGAFDNTLILFGSDNGASAEIMVRGGGHDPRAAPGSAATYLSLGPGWSSAANTPFRRHKTWVHEGGIATPLIAHWPAGIRARGELRHTPVHLIDVAPTLLELSGGSRPAVVRGHPVPPWPGRSLVPAFAADGPLDREFLWWEHEGNRALRAGDWKLVAVKDGPWELYDLASDRGEQRDLAAAQPERVRALAALWERQVEENGRLARTDPPPAAAPGAKQGKRKQP